MSEPTSISNFRSACPALRDVWPVLTVMTAPSADPTMSLMPTVASVSRSVVMDSDTPHNATMEIT